jgi:pyrroloquinoline-quinone synthase
MTAARFLDDVRARVLDHAVVRHPLLQSFERGDVTWEQARLFGLLYWPHIARTRLYQAAALSVTPHEDLQAAYAAILHDEYGCGDANRTHPAIYRRFLHALDWSPKDWDAVELWPALSDYVAVHGRLCGGGDWLVAAGAAGLAMEWPIPPMYERLLGGLRRFPQLSESALEIFTGHIGQDEDHARCVSDALARHLDASDARRRVEQGVWISLEARHRMLDALWAALSVPAAA